MRWPLLFDNRCSPRPAARNVGQKSGLRVGPGIEFECGLRDQLRGRFERLATTICRALPASLGEMVLSSESAQADQETDGTHTNTNLRAHGVNSAETWMERTGKGRKHLKEKQRQVERAGGWGLCDLPAPARG